MPEPPGLWIEILLQLQLGLPCLLSQHHLESALHERVLAVLLHEGARQERGLLFLAVPRAPDLFRVSA